MLSLASPKCETHSIETALAEKKGKTGGEPSRTPGEAKLCEKNLSFLACFSSRGDLLSQWGAYADEAAGFAIGFSGPGIDALCSNHPLKTTKRGTLLEPRLL